MAERVITTAKTQESKQKCSNSCKQNVGFHSSGSTADMILQLQRTAGNQTVQRLIKSRALQAKLRVGQPNDIYEQEADRVTEQVMRMSDRVIQRKCAKCDKDEKKILLAKKSPEQISATQNENKPPLVHEVLSLPGQPLDPGTRAFMEPRFGYDFSRVRVHTDSAAEQSARDLNANAYTVGHDIVFGAGQFTPGALRGRQLIAHELTHVIQQRSMVQPQIQKQSIHNPLFPCYETALMPGGMDFFGTLVHLAIQQHYVRNIDPMAGTEYVIPDSSAGGATGRADIVDSYGGVYEIKPLGLVTQGFIEAENYVSSAEINCDPLVNWHLGTLYFPPAVPMIINGFLIISWLYGPGVIAYTRREIPPVPVRVPETKQVNRPVHKPSTYKLILEWASQVIKSGADATQAANEFLGQHPEIAWTILILGVVGIIALAADDVTLAGIADDVLIPVIATLMRVAWRFV